MECFLVRGRHRIVYSLRFAKYYFVWFDQFYFSYYGKKVKYLSESRISKLMNEFDSEIEESGFLTVNLTV